MTNNNLPNQFEILRMFKGPDMFERSHIYYQHFHSQIAFNQAFNIIHSIMHSIIQTLRWFLKFNKFIHTLRWRRQFSSNQKLFYCINVPVVNFHCLI